MRIALLTLVLLAGTCAAQTPAVCPWISTGTAASVLGGPVALSAHVQDNWQGVCRFTRQSGGEKEALEITIDKKDTHVCPPGSPKLVAIGNEAVQCNSKNAQGSFVDLISGRMRNVYFVISINSVTPASTVPSATLHPHDSYSASAFERVAEQVVGNLY